MAKKPKKPIPIYQLKIVICEIDPPVWRILQIKGNASLGKLHDYIQGAMGWRDSHLHEFKINGKSFRDKQQMSDEFDADMYDERKYTLKKLLMEGDSFEYEYDFGDCWEHDITVEKIIPPKEEVYYPVCIYGERACPPEDCGGTRGYEELLQVLNDFTHEDHEHFTEWAGKDFDPDKFDSKRADLIMDNIKGNVREARSNWI